MKTLEIKSTNSTPSIFFNDKGILIISGRSLPENPINFYKDILGEISKYVELNKGKLCVTFEFEYINTSSTRCLLDLFKIVLKNKQGFLVTWKYEEGDDEMLELGEYFEEILGVKFEKQIFVKI